MLDATEVRDAFPKPQSQAFTLAGLKRASRWLSDFAASVTSQNGEDGIVAKALSLLPDLNHWCVEFGAWDGVHRSNTANLIRNHDYSAVLIEGDPAKYRELASNYADNPRVIARNQFVGFTSDNNLDRELRDRLGR